MKRKIQLLRHGIQLAAFLVMPGLFTLTFSAVGSVYRALAAGTWDWNRMAYDVALLVAVFPITILWGRFFCGFLCSFGAMGDLLWALSRRFTKKKIILQPRTEALLQKVKYIFLVAIFVCFWSLQMPLPDNWSPWYVFGVYTTPRGWQDLSLFATVGGAYLVMIVITSLVFERCFCRWFCPLGALFSLVSRKRLFTIRKPRKNCGPCRLCTWECSMGLDLTQTDAIRSGNCIDCFQCVSHCPKDNMKTAPAPAVAGTAAALGMAGLYFAGNIAVEQALPRSGRSVAVERQGQYRDGIYTGSGKGFSGTTQVQVTVRGGNITDITIVSHQDSKRYFDQASAGLIPAIIASQDVAGAAVVSGATYSSYGLKEAVAKAVNVPFTNPNYTQKPVLHH